MSSETELDVMGDVLKHESYSEFCREKKTLTTAQTIAIGDVLVDDTLLATVATKEISIPLTDGNTVAAWKDALPDAADATSIGLADAQGSPLLGATTISTSTASSSETASYEITIPDDYVAGSTVSIRIRAKTTALATVSDLVDITAQLIGDTLGADINGTAATQMTIAYADYDFVVAPATLIPGAKLLITLTLSRNDTGGAAISGAPSAVDISMVYGSEATYSYVAEAAAGSEKNIKYVALEAVTTVGSTDSILVLARNAIVNQSQLNLSAFTAADVYRALQLQGIIVRQQPTQTTTQTT